MKSLRKKKKIMNIAFATSECVPYVKTGGLADVSGSLPIALNDAGCHVKVFLPLYGGIKTIDHKLSPLNDFPDFVIDISGIPHKINIWYGKLPKSEVEAYFIDCPYYFHRELPYTNDSDEDERFILFQLAVLQTLQRMKWAPDVIHCNDWPTALIPVYLKTSFSWDKLFAKTKSFLSIHNIGYQGVFDKSTVIKAKLDPTYYYPEGPFEYHKAFSFLKAGILFADKISTVSPTYAKEIQTVEYGAGLEGVLASRGDDIIGILNGIDTDVWNPCKDKFLKIEYDSSTIDKKEENKKYMYERIEMDYSPDFPAIGIITRLTGQKGIELLLPIAEELMKLNIHIITLGSGEKKYEEFFKQMHKRFPHKFYSYIGYSNELSHIITAGCDMFLMPSKYEPCGLNQMYSLAYGTIPIVRKTGGLADTVFDYHEHKEEGNGFSFEAYEPLVVLETIKRAANIYNNKGVWKGIQQTAMKGDFSWKSSAEKYCSTYGNLNKA